MARLKLGKENWTTNPGLAGIEVATRMRDDAVLCHPSLPWAQMSERLTDNRVPSPRKNERASTS